MSAPKGHSSFRAVMFKSTVQKNHSFLRHAHLGGKFFGRVSLRVSCRIEAISGKTADEGFDLRVKWDALLNFRRNNALHPRHSLKGSLKDFSGQEYPIHLRPSLLKHRELGQRLDDAFLKQTLEDALHMFSDPTKFLHKCRICHRAGAIPVAVA